MPLTWTIDVENRRMEARVVGEIGLEEMLDAIDRSTTDPRFRPGFDILSDHTGITRIISTDQVQGVIAHLRAMADRLTGSRWAVWTTQPASYGMMRMLAVHAESVPIQVRVFERKEDAEAWLASPRKPGSRSDNTDG